MSGLEEDTIGGYNPMLTKQQKEEGGAIVTTVLFDHGYELIHNRIDIQEIKLLTDKEYFVRGTTALLDAVVMTINEIIRATKNSKKEYQASRVVFVIITDGLENSSTEYSYQNVKNMIDKQKERYNWEFIFLGANIDAVETASKFGIKKDRAVNYIADSEGTKLNYEAVSDVIVEMRRGKKVDRNWKRRIEEDYKKRGEKINK